MKPEIFILLLLTILPTIYKYLFWYFVIQTKEYRTDRFKEYLSTNQWAKAMKNALFFIELPIFIFSIYYLYNNNVEIILQNTLFLLLVLENLFVIWKIIKWNIFKPKMTSRLLVTLVITFITLIILFLSINTYLFIFINLLFVPFAIFLSIFFSLPVVILKKNKILKTAIKISKKHKNPIKVWVTWSYWKSSVKEYLSQILSLNNKVLSTPENINTELWISDLIINKFKNRFDYFIAEMWAYKRWEIKTLWNIVNHKHWFITAIWNQHLALFGSIENTIKAKSEIEKRVNKNRWNLYINWDDENIRKAKFKKNTNIVKYWTRKKSDAHSEITAVKNWKTEFTFSYWKINTKLKTNLLWKHNIVNLTWILAFCFDQAMNITQVREAILDLKSPENTLELIEKKWNILINDTCNLSEWSLFAGLDVMKLHSKKHNKILVLDDILELWENASAIHQKIWKQIAKKKLAKQVVFIWETHRADIVKWLVKWGFKVRDIIPNLDYIKEWNVILFEWKNTKLLFNELIWKK